MNVIDCFEYTNVSQVHKATPQTLVLLPCFVPFIIELDAPLQRVCAPRGPSCSRGRRRGPSRALHAAGRAGLRAPPAAAAPDHIAPPAGGPRGSASDAAQRELELRPDGDGGNPEGVVK